MVNTVHFTQVPSDPNPFNLTVMQAMVQDVYTSFTAAFKSLLSDQVTWDSGQLTEILNLAQDTREEPAHPFIWPRGRQASFATANGGTVGTDALPSYASVCAQLRTGFAGRQNRGSMHFSGIPESATAYNRLQTVPLSNWQAAVDSFFTATFTYTVSAVTYIFLPTIFSAYPLLDVGPAGTTPYSRCRPIQTTPVNSKLGTMRRRKLKGGAP